MAGGDILKMDIITELPHAVMLNELSFIKRKNDELKSLELKNRK